MEACGIRMRLSVGTVVSTTAGIETYLSYSNDVYSVELCKRHFKGNTVCVLEITVYSDVKIKIPGQISSSSYPSIF
jgi:hypothetical protein